MRARRRNRRRTKRLTRVVFFLFLAGNLLTILLLWLCAASVFVPPTTLKLLVSFELAFPVFLAVNAVFVVLWALFRWRMIWLPALGFVACLGSLRVYCPINFPKSIPEKHIKLLSYNVKNFVDSKTADGSLNRVLAYLKNSDADIIMLQESEGLSAEEWREKGLPALKDYPYKDTASFGWHATSLICFSRYPVLHIQTLRYEGSTNGSAAFTIDIDGDTVVVINNHFESIKLTESDREAYKSIIKGVESTEIKREIANLASKIDYAGARRCQQVDTVAAFIRNSPVKSILLCGDFNDTPISYSRYKMAELLTDAYATSGNGPGFSFRQDGMWIRIDHIFCSADWKPYQTVVDHSIVASDHYPIYSFLVKERKP